MTTLCIDFGNTRLKAAVFHDHSFMEEINIESDTIETISSLLVKYNPAKTILSSVINHNPEIEILLASKTLFHKLSNQSKLNFKIAVSKPDTIGPDRLALIAAACDLFPGKNNLVIGMGSCITYNFVNHQSQFLGGAISPGMDMRFKSMHEYTAKLPLVQNDWNFPLIGYDTKTNLQSGVIFGIASEIDGFIEKYSNKYGNFNVVLTGGDAPYFASQLKNKIFADVYFLFKGLYALSELNN
jgi:type III pantothenate kinase